MAARVIIRIEITRDARTTFNNAAEQYGMSQIGVASRLLEWCAKQDEGVQAAILGQYPKALEPEFAKLLLKQLG
jgi:hypothetical protein